MEYHGFKWKKVGKCGGLLWKDKQTGVIGFFLPIFATGLLRTVQKPVSSLSI